MYQYSITQSVKEIQPQSVTLISLRLVNTWSDNTDHVSTNHFLLLHTQEQRVASRSMSPHCHHLTVSPLPVLLSSLFHPPARCCCCRYYYYNYYYY